MADSTQQSELLSKLPWLLFLRVLVVSILLGAAAAYYYFAIRRPIEDPTFFRLLALVLFAYVYSLLAVPFIILKAAVVSVSFAQVLGEAAIATMLVHLTGGSESVFNFMYVLAIINGAILLFRKGALTAALASATMYAGLLYGEVIGQFQYFDATGNALARLTIATATFSGFTNFSAFFLVAGLASYLTEEIRDASQKLSVKTSEMARLTSLHENIVRSIPSGLLVLDEQERIVFANQAAMALTGLDAPRLVGVNLRELFREWSFRPDQLADADFRYSNPQDEVRYFRATKARLPAARAAPFNYLVVFSDFTQLHGMEQQVARAERLAALGRLSAGLAHEIRNPLASMSGAVQLLQKKIPGAEPTGRLMNIVLRETERLNQLITEFLAFARPKPIDLQPMDYHQVVRELLDAFRLDPLISNRVELRLHGEAGLFAMGDPDLIKQMVWNLLTNAAQAIAVKGRIEVTSKINGGFIELSVRDNGAGIPAENLNSIFDPFFTTKEDGTGLGLATVFRIVESHGGRVEVQSQPGQGATFTAQIPYVPAPETLPDRQPGAAAHSAAR